MIRSRTFASIAFTLLSACYGPEPAGEQPSADRVPFEYIVGHTAGMGEAELEELLTARGFELIAVDEEGACAIIADPEERPEAEALAALAADGPWTYAEPQFLYHPSFQPNDWGEYLWGLHNTGLGGGRAGADLGAFAAWDLGRGQGVVVAIVDTGLDTTHPDLRPNLWTNTAEIAGNNRDDDGNGYVDDVHGFDFVRRRGDPVDHDAHGTHVAGTVGAVGNNGEGVVGVAFQSRLMGLKFMEGNQGGTASQAAEAIRYAVRNGATVINASWGGPGSSTTIRNAIQYARQNGVIVVAAAGNEGANNDTVASYPANYDLDNVLSVAASDRRDRLASFSNYGRTKVDLAAPGVDIVSTLPGGDFGYMDGTSMACPHVAGALAVLRSARPQATVTELRAAILGGVEPLQSGAGSIVTGGRLDLGLALTRLGVTAPDQQEAPVEEVPTEDDPAPAPPSEQPFTYVDFPVESAHPYADNFAGSVGITAPVGATQIVLHWDRLEVETNYDVVRVVSEGGAVLASWTGSHGAFDSDPIPARDVDLELRTDGSVTQWGLRLRGFSYR